MSKIKQMLAEGPKPANLPTVVAVLGVIDGGPCTDHMTATCPHCGAEGRWIIKFMCDDGTIRGAMRGCFTLFRGSNTRTAKLVQEAFTRKAGAIEAKTKLAAWWQDMVTEAEDFAANGSLAEFPVFTQRIMAIEERRHTWLKRNGYCRR